MDRETEIAIYYGYNRFVEISADAKNKLPRLFKAVEDGEVVTICRHGTPVVDIVRTTQADSEKPKLGPWRVGFTECDSTSGSR